MQESAFNAPAFEKKLPPLPVKLSQYIKSSLERSVTANMSAAQLLNPKAESRVSLDPLLMKNQLTLCREEVKL
jgi:hypothetical protein